MTYYNVQNYGAKGDGVTDDAPAINQLLTTIAGSLAAGCPGAAIYFPEGEYVISESLNFHRFSGIVLGDGQGQSPQYSATPGHGSVIRWTGASTSPMLYVTDCETLVFSTLRLQGGANPPTYAIQFDSITGADHGCNHYCTVSDVTIGKYPWDTAGSVQTGIGWTGLNANNDQFHLHRVWIQCPTTYGVYIENSQSIWGSLRDVRFESCYEAGLCTNADTTLHNCTFNRCGVDIMAEQAAQVNVAGWYSENSKQMATMSSNAKLYVRGGLIQAGSMTGGSMIAASPSNATTIALEDITFTQSTTPTVAIQPIGRVFVDVKRCRGIIPSQLTCGTVTGRAVVEWVSADGLDSSDSPKKTYQFRNELAASGSGTRTTLDTSVWDTPVAGAF